MQLCRFCSPQFNLPSDLTERKLEPMEKTKAAKQFNATARMQIDSIRIVREIDECPDLSWLEQTDAEMGEGFEANSKARLADYGNGWCMIGIRAEATVSYPIGQGSRRLETFRSGGLWGIESDSDASYFAEVAREELNDLRQHLEAFGVPWDEEAAEEALEQA